MKYKEIAKYLQKMTLFKLIENVQVWEDRRMAEGYFG